MEKVFVVTTGRDDDYRIVGVFSSREKAMECCPVADPEVAIPQYEDRPSIEEWPLDIMSNASRYEKEKTDGGIMQNLFTVGVDMETGAIAYEASRIDVKPRDWARGREGRRVDGQGFVATSFGESVVSAEHALTIAAEHRQALLRERAIMPQPQ